MGQGHVRSDGRLIVHFPLLLQQHRTRACASQRRLAEMIGVHPTYISRIEAGSRIPSKRVTLAIADKLGLTPLERRELYEAAHGIDPDRPLGSGYRRIIEAIHDAASWHRDIDPEAADALITLLRASVKPLTWIPPAQTALVDPSLNWSSSHYEAE